MKKFSTKGALLFAAAIALCAFAMPSMASASSWGVVGTEHTLTSTDFGFRSDNLGSESMCADVQFTVDVVSAAVIEITTGTFTNCTWIAEPGAGATCNATSVGTNFPWTATARTTSDIQIHGVNINVFTENTSGGVNDCGALTNQVMKITGTLAGARWLGNVGPRRIELFNATGLVAHAPLGLGSSPLTPTGTITDLQETLTVTN